MAKLPEEMKGSLLLMQDVPENTEVGVDMKFWRTGKNFRGIKEIPPGFHYFYYSAVNSECKSGQRRGFCEWFSQPSIVVKRWHPAEEDFVDVPLTDDDLQRLLDNYEEICLYLGPYPKELHRDWVALTSLIGPTTVSRLMPECGRVASCAQFLSEPSSSQQRLHAKQTTSPPDLPSSNPEDLLPKLDVVPGTEVRFIHLPKKPLFPSDCAPIDITAHAIDQTYTLNSVLNTPFSPADSNEHRSVVGSPNWMHHLSPEERELLAELQFSYVVFLLNHLLEGWYHWRQLVQLLSNCETAIGQRPQLYLALITVLHHQLCSASHSKDFLDSNSADLSTMQLADLFFSEASDRSTEPAFLPHAMRLLLRNLFGSKASGPTVLHRELQERAEGFCHSLEHRFHWGLKPDTLRHESTVEELLVDDVDWDGEEAPVIVQL